MIVSYRTLIADNLTPELLALIRLITNVCQIPDYEDFKNQIEIMLGDRVRLGKGGRPKKAGLEQSRFDPIYSTPFILKKQV